MPSPLEKTAFASLRSRIGAKSLPSFDDLRAGSIEQKSANLQKSGTIVTSAGRSGIGILPIEKPDESRPERPAAMCRVADPCGTG
jgi:hypothetical protein